VKADLLNSTTILIDNEHFSAWPKFGHLGIKKLRGLWNPQHLKWLLREEDLFCDVWRRPIPIDVLREIRRCPDYHSELIELAQLDPTRFVQLSQSNPALTIIVAAYWAFRAPWRMPSRIKRDTFRRQLLVLKHREILSEICLPAENELTRILRKIPVSYGYISHLKNTLVIYQDKERRRFLRHLNTLTPAIVKLMQHPELPIDMPLLELCAKEPTRNTFYLPDVVSSIVTAREMSCLKPTWPYKGMIRSWESLLRVEWDNALHCGLQSLQFPPPPISVDPLAEALEIAPLHTPQLVIEEAEKMGNCCALFIQAIHSGESYLYRVKKPERATLLLHREPSSWEWQVEEIGLRQNIGEVSARTENLIYYWIRQNKKMAQRLKTK
jgi:hypothetical protein